MKTLFLAVCLFLLIPGSAALSQPFPSFMLDSAIVRMPGFGDVTGTRVAFGPDVGLVVWTTELNVLGARVDRNGALLDTVQIDIDGPDIDEWVYARPGVAWSGRNFLVVWSNWEVTRCALVQPDGQVTVRSVLQDSAHTSQRDLSVAFDGTNFLAAWTAQHDTFGMTAFYARVSPQGIVLDSPPRIVAPLRAGRQRDIEVCFHGDRYLAVWNGWDTIGVNGSFIRPDGSIADSAGFPIRRGIGTASPAVAHDGQNFLVSWYEYHYKTKLARVTDDGMLLDTNGVLIDSFSLEQAALVSSGDTTLVVFRHDPIWHWDSLTLVAVRMDAAMNRLDEIPVAVSAPGNEHFRAAPQDPAVGLCGEDYFFAWTQPLMLDEYADDNRQALSRRMNRNGELIDSTPAVLSYGVNEQSCPDVASDGDNFLAVWTETRHDSVAREYSVRCIRFTDEGTPLDSSPVKLGIAQYEVPPAVAFGDGCYLVTWKDSGGICAKRLTPAGVVLDSTPLRMPDPYSAYPFTDVAYGDSFFLVAWSRGSVRGFRVSPAGAILDTAPLQLAVNPYDSRFPRVAFDGDNFLVARRDGDNIHRCVRVNQDGAILDTDDITLGPAAENYYRWDMPEVEYGHSIYFVVDDFTASWCWRLTPSGKPFDSVPIANLQFADVVFDGNDFMLLCQSRDSTGSLTDNLGAIRITPEGRVLDSTPFTLVTGDSSVCSAQQAAMCTNEAQRVGVVFTGFEPPPYLASRIRAATFPAIVGIGSQHELEQPVAFRVQPNPASRMASLSFNLTQAGTVRVTAFDATGRRCANLHSGPMNAGRQTLPMDTRALANGVYFVRLETRTASHSTRLVVSH